MISAHAGGRRFVSSLLEAKYVFTIHSTKIAVKVGDECVGFSLKPDHLLLIIAEQAMFVFYRVFTEGEFKRKKEVFREPATWSRDYNAWFVFVERSRFKKGVDYRVELVAEGAEDVRPNGEFRMP